MVKLYLIIQNGEEIGELYLKINTIIRLREKKYTSLCNINIINNKTRYVRARARVCVSAIVDEALLIIIPTVAVPFVITKKFFMAIRVNSHERTLFINVNSFIVNQQNTYDSYRRA